MLVSASFLYSVDGRFAEFRIVLAARHSSTLRQVLEYSPQSTLADSARRGGAKGTDVAGHALRRMFFGRVCEAGEGKSGIFVPREFICQKSMGKNTVDVAVFRQQVYDVVAAIPRGKVLAYGDVAWLAGRPRHARLVGRLLGDAPPDRGLPCHRVVNSAGRTAPHWPGQVERLKAEGVVFRPNGCVDMKACRWSMDVAD